MTWHFDPETHGFYNTDLHETIPETAQEITEDEYHDLLMACTRGATIEIRGGQCVAVEFEPTDAEFNEGQRALRQAAYESHADPLAFKFMASNNEADRAAWDEARAKIKEAYPYRGDPDENANSS